MSKIMNATFLREITRTTINKHKLDDIHKAYDIIDLCKIAAEDGLFYIVWDKEFSVETQNELRKHGFKIILHSFINESNSYEISWKE